MRRTPLQLTDDPYLEMELDMIPNLDLDTLRRLQHVNEEENTELEDEINQLESSRTARVNQIPYHLIELEEEIRWFINSKLLKPNINQKTGVDFSEITIQFAKSPEFDNLMREVFWLIHYIQLYPKKEKLIEKLRKKVTKCYAEILPKIQKCDKLTTEAVLMQLQFLIAYVTHATHYKRFPEIREKFDTRFILDCYHIVVFELTGLLVSDFFVHKNIENFFGDKLFFYKEESALKLTEIDPAQGSTFLSSYGKFKKNYDSLKMNQYNSYDSKNMAFEFYQLLSKKFAYIDKFNTKKTGLMTNLLQSEYKKRLADLAGMSKFDRAVLRFRIEDADKKLKNNIFKQEIKDSEYQDKEFNRRMQIYLNQKKPKIYKKFKFDCTQISPPLRDLIGNGSKMPVNKKQIHMSNVQLPDFSAKDLATLYNKNTTSSIKLTKRDVTADKLNHFFGKKLHEHANLIKNNKKADKLMKTKGLKQSLKRKFLTFYQVLDNNTNKGILNLKKDMERLKNLSYIGVSSKEEKQWEDMVEKMEKEKLEKIEKIKEEKMKKAIFELNKRTKNKVDNKVGGAFLKIFQKTKEERKFGVLEQLERNNKLNDGRSDRRMTERSRGSSTYRRKDSQKSNSYSRKRNNRRKLKPIKNNSLVKKTALNGGTHIKRKDGSVDYFNNNRYFEKKKLEFLKSIDKPDKNIKSLSEKINFNKLKQEEMHK